MGGGGANKPLTNSLKTLKNSKPQKLTKNPKKIQDSIQLDSKFQDSKKSSKTISKIGISIIASVLLSQNLAALPAGGKFIHGSGSISKNGNTMNITGNNTNHVIAWGGGFNIAKGETVNFKGSDKAKAFLNLDYTNKASRILGNLNGNGNNIYLVNPSGVLIGAGANVNANRFVASTSSLNQALNDFTRLATNNGDQNAVNFSPVYSRNNLKGSIVNMGTIKANHIILVGQNVRNLASQNENDINGTRGTFNHTGSLKIIGQSIFLDVDGVTNKNNIEVVATNPIDGQTSPDIKIQMSMNTFATKGYTDNWIAKKYSATGETFSNGKYYFYNIITIGATDGWTKFANAWNNGLGITRDIEEFKLISNLNFSGVDFVSVGKPENYGFNRIFNGNGYKMSNITLNDGDTSSKNGAIVAGVFNKVGGGTIKNLTIDGVTANISRNDILHLGGFAGQINGGNINNVTVNNINLNGTISNHGYVGGFAGVINGGNISNVTLNNINKLYLYSTQYTGSNMYMGGFAGRIADSSGTINNVILNKIGTLQTDVVTGYGSSGNTAMGGFTSQLGSGHSISNIFLYYNENSKFMPAGALGDNKDSRLKIATFYHSMTGNNTFNNINIVYNTHITDPSPYGSGIIFDRDGYNIDQATKRIYYTAKGAIDGVKQVADADRNKYGNTVKFTDYMYPENDQTFKNTVGNRQGLKVTNYNYSWVTSVKNSNVFGDAHNNTSSDYQTLINTYLPQIIDDILEADYEVTIENDKGTSTQTALQDIMKRITNILNAINSKEGEGSADSKITNFLNQILVGNDKNNAELKESIKQSINFLRAFYDGYNGSEQAVTKASYNKNIFNSFASNTNYKNATDKYNNTIKGGMNNLKNTINGKLADIKTLENTLKNLADALNKAQELNNQGTALNQQVENYKNQIESLNNEIANLEKAIAGLGGMIGQDKLQPMKKQLEAKKAERDQARTNGEKAIAQIQSLKTQLATLKNNVDDYVTTINGIRDEFKQDLNINQAQDIEVMAGGAKGSFTYYGVETMAQNDITDNINVPSMNPDPDPITPPGGGGGTDPVDPTPDPDPVDPTPDPDPDPDPITPPGGGDGGDGTDPDPDPTNPPGGGDGGGTNPNPDDGNNGGDNGDNGYEGDDTVNNNSGYDARLAYLNYKREVLELPAEEETSIEINEGREKGRLCIVSDNAKTNNPCMAITY